MFARCEVTTKFHFSKDNIAIILFQFCYSRTNDNFMTVFSWYISKQLQQKSSNKDKILYKELLSILYMLSLYFSDYPAYQYLMISSYKEKMTIIDKNSNKMLCLFTTIIAKKL